MKRRGAILAAGLALAASWSAQADEGPLQYSGSLRTYASGFFFAGQSGAGLFTQRFRSRLRWTPDARDSFEAAYDLTPEIGSISGFSGSIPVPQPQSYRVADAPSYLSPFNSTPAGTFGLAENLDRLSYTMNRGPVTITAGRQAISFGAAHVECPTDVFAPFSLSTLDQEDRVGVDALRLRVSTGELQEADVGYVAGRRFAIEHSGAFARYRAHFFDTDATASVVEFQGDTLLGLDAVRSLWGATLWVEGAEVLAAASYFRISAGGDYSFAQGLYVFVEYHDNGAGTFDPSAYAALTTTDAYTKGGDTLLGKHYLAVGLRYEISPLWTASATALCNLTDPSALVTAKVDYDLAQDATVELGALVPAGAGTAALPGSEFGLYPDIFYTAVKVYF